MAISTLILTLCLSSAAPISHEPIAANTLARLHALYPVGEDTWGDVDQPFWPHFRVLKLLSTSRPAAYHRPTVAIDSSGDLHVLTDGFFRVPPKEPLAEFNSISAIEGIRISASNVASYAQFFLASYLLIGDDYCLSATLPTFDENGAGLLPESLCAARPPFRLTERGSDFVLDTVLVNRKGRWVRAHRFLLSSTGEITSLWQ